MTETTDKQAAEKGDKGKKALQKTDSQSTSKSGSSIFNKSLHGLAIVLVIVAIGLAVNNYQSLTGIQSSLSSADVAENDFRKSIAELEKELQTSQSRFTTIKKQFDELASRQDVLRDLIPEPIAETIDINHEFALAEIEHLLTIANYRLQLNHDVATAIAAMQTADQRLRGLDLPRALQVREQIIADINELRSLNQADLSGLGLFLSDLINRIDGLPLQEAVLVRAPEFDKPVAADATEQNNVKKFFTLVWTELKSLVIISRDQKVNRAHLLPDEIYFLRSNIKLELANARFAVFNRDTENFRASIAHIQRWLDTYFDLADAAVRNVYDSLGRMQRLELAFPDIDISSSLESARALSRQVSEEAMSATEQETTTD